jgi:aspartate kinase
MPVRVYKFGGASLADVDKVKAVADFLKKEKLKYKVPLLVVVSAMGQTTDELIALAKKVSSHPQKRELDMLLTVGERVSMALMSLALNERGVPAISFTGSQAGILTDSSHGNARIIDIRPFRLEEHFQKDVTVVLAGFQGVSSTTKEVTTLGRGGTDTTALAMASFFKAPICEFKKDVGGVFSADPKIIPNAKHLPQLSYKNLIDMTFWGGKFLHYRAAELAFFLKLPIKFSHFQNENEFTLVSGDETMLEQQRILAINSHKDVFELSFKNMDSPKALDAIQTHINKNNIAHPQILAVNTVGGTTRILGVGELGERCTDLPCETRTLSSVTMTCQGAVNSELIFKTSEQLKQFATYEILQDTTNLTVIASKEDREKIIKQLHGMIL